MRNTPAILGEKTHAAAKARNATGTAARAHAWNEVQPEKGGEVQQKGRLSATLPDAAHAGQQPEAISRKDCGNNARSNCHNVTGKAVKAIPGESSQKPLKNPIAGKIRISIAKIF